MHRLEDLNIFSDFMLILLSIVVLITYQNWREFNSWKYKTKLSKENIVISTWKFQVETSKKLYISEASELKKKKKKQFVGERAPLYKQLCTSLIVRVGVNVNRY